MKQFFTIMCLLLLAQAQATVRRVKAGSSYPNGPGTDWVNAFNNVQDAIDYSNPGDEVWIAAGTYTLGSGLSFYIRNSVRIYGGFAGVSSAETVATRNWRTNVTILQGAGASVLVPASGVTLYNSTTSIDGLTVQGGRAYQGAGIDLRGGTVALTNLTFTDNIATSYGGAIWAANFTFPITNCIFQNNKAQYGAGVYNDDAYPVFKNCVFASNTATTDGGGVYSYISSGNISSRKATFLNNVFYGNTATNGGGGGIYNSTSSPNITNCTFVNNAALLNTGAAVYNKDDYNSGSYPPNPTITNCAFWNNRSTSLNSTTDIGSYQNDIGSTSVTYSYFKETSTYPGTGNITTGSTSPLVNVASPLGADNRWMTADDGLLPNLCGGLIDIGNNNAISEALDITRRTRKYDNLLANAVGNGTQPYVDLGAYEDQTATTVAQIAGALGNAHTIPNPQELVPDYITSTVAPATGTLSWEKSTDGGNTWAPATPAGNQATYAIPALTQTTQFRRVVTATAYCGNKYYTTPVEIKVVNSDGVITGIVRSRNGNPVQGIVIQIKRLTTGIAGTPDNYTYYTTTGTNGTYTVSPIYYGDFTSGSVSANFSVTPVKANHIFNYDFLSETLTNNIRRVDAVDFIDRTTFSVTGRTYQQCTDCIGASSASPVQCPVDSINIWTGSGYATPSFYSRTGFIDTAYGRYAISITDPDSLRIEPRYNGHRFDVAFKKFKVTGDTAGVDFRDTTTHIIRGKLTDGCGKAIGVATLEFDDVLPNDASGNPRSGCFRKTVTTAPGSGYYEIRLPARKYSVRVTAFTPVDGSQDLMTTNVRDFFDNKVPKDSLTRNIDMKDDTINLMYQRYPSITLISGLNTLCSNGTDRGYALIQQGITDSFKIRVLQGPVSGGCPIIDTTTKLNLFTNVPVNDNSTSVSMQYNLTKDTITVRLKGGTPNIISPYYKTLNLQFTDRYGRVATAINKNAVVTGVKADVATFTTVSPQIPMLILHDPPGDQSFSTWQKDSTAQSAFRLYAATNNSTDIWGQVKIGAKSEAGIGVMIESEVWGTVNGALNVTSNNTTSNETILTTTATQSFSTSSSPTVTDADGDVYVGAALNLIYAGSTEVAYNAANCNIGTSRKLVVANNGFATQYVYTDRFIRTTLIPNLNALANSPNNAARKDSFLNQVKVWQQVLENNKANKARASYDKNISFDGSAGPITNQTSSSVASTNTVEFNLSIDASLATELGFEVAGSGASGGVTVAFKTETGASTSTTLTNQTTIGYILDDKDDGDYFSVDIKKDPVYSTPVFQLAAATASCPPEPGAQPRDEVQLNIPVPAVSGVPESNGALFTLKLGNTSQSGETRTYKLSLDPTSNPYGARVYINGRQIQSETYAIPYLGEQNVTVAVYKEPSSPVFSYEGIRFTLSDNCTGDISKTGIISANFVSQCSSITLAQPENNWVLNAAANNLLPVLLKDYDVTRLSSITLEYSKAGTSNWVESFTRTASQLNTNGANGTIVNWNTASLVDSVYNLRLKLNCPQGTVYSQRATGIIDRKAPELFGRPQPTDDNYQNGDVISFAYNEPITVSNLNNGQVTMRRLSNNQLIPVTVSGYGNQIIITPNNSITGLVGDSIRVIVQNIADQYGNVKATPDTTRFTVGTTVASTGPRALNVSIINPVLSNTDAGTMDIYFTMPGTETFDRRVYYTITGTAILRNEYDTILPATNRSVNSFNGTQGVIVIPAGSRQAILKLDPIFRNTPGPDKTIRISLTQGGDYTLGANTVVTGTITYATILPLKLISFTGKPVGEAVNLQWQTANEINTASFTVEKSADGITFASFASVAAKGSGNNSYSTTDANPFVGKSFYRLKMIDKDGQLAYSNIVMVTMAPRPLQLISLSPSPLVSQAGKLSLVAAKASKLEIVVIDLAGRQVAVQPVTTTAGNSTLSLTLPYLQPGIYTLYAMDGTTKSNMVRFVKQ